MVSNSNLTRSRRIPARGGRARGCPTRLGARCVLGGRAGWWARQERALGLTARSSGWAVSAPRGGARRGSERAPAGSAQKRAGQGSERRRVHARRRRERAAGRPGTVGETRASRPAIRRREGSGWRAGWTPAVPRERAYAR